MQSYLKELYESFRRVHGIPAVLVGFALNILVFVLKPDQTFSVKIILPVGVVILLILMTYIDLSLRLHVLAQKVLPKVKHGSKAIPPYQDAVAILLLEGSQLFGHESLVTIYQMQEDL